MWEMRSVGAVRCGVKYVTEICAQLRERLERGACHGGLGFVDLRHVTEICAQLRERLERGACHVDLRHVTEICAHL
jgi:hypothetical protein